MKRIWLRHGADMERVTLHCTDPENSLGIAGLVASSDVLRLVLSDTVALCIVRIPADRLSSRPEVAFCAWLGTFLSVAIWQHLCKRQLESSLQLKMSHFSFSSPEFDGRTRTQGDPS